MAIRLVIPIAVVAWVCFAVAVFGQQGPAWTKDARSLTPVYGALGTLVGQETSYGSDRLLLAHDEDHSHSPASDHPQSSKAETEAHFHAESPDEKHHDEGHDDEHEHFDSFGPPHHRHTTKDGFPVFEAFKTDHAFIERKVRVDFLTTTHADQGRANQSQFNGELFWAFNNRIAGVIATPLIFRNAQDVGRVTGFGDLEIGARFVAFNAEYSILTFGLNISAPTGNSGEGLGEGFTSVGPVALLWHDLGGGNVLQSECAVESPVGVHEGESLFRYNFAFSHTLRSTEHLRFFHWLTPLIELNGLTSLNGDSSGCTEIDLTPGVRWAITNEDHAGIAFSFPISGTRDFDNQFIVSFIHHF
jgi:hypothetical protein